MRFRRRHYAASQFITLSCILALMRRAMAFFASRICRRCFAASFFAAAAPFSPCEHVLPLRFHAILHNGWPAFTPPPPIFAAAAVFFAIAPWQ
jgi:hypothetical protein